MSIFQKKLTPLQARFCEEYLIDFSPTRAAKRAGFANPVYGRELFGKSHIKAAINRIQNQAGNQTGVTIAYVIEQLTKTYLIAKEKGELSTAYVHWSFLASTLERLRRIISRRKERYKFIWISGEAKL